MTAENTNNIHALTTMHYIKYHIVTICYVKYNFRKEKASSNTT